MGLEAVKDPWVIQWQGRWHPFLSVAMSTGDTSAESHETADIYKTGRCVTGTALAISDDLDNWDWKGVVLGAGKSGWDAYARRINRVIPAGDGWIAFYDGIASHSDNYEEKTSCRLFRSLAAGAFRHLATPDCGRRKNSCRIERISHSLFIHEEGYYTRFTISRYPTLAGGESPSYTSFKAALLYKGIALVQ